MKNKLGYSEGAGTNIATHSVIQAGATIHMQRIMNGAGALSLEWILENHTGTNWSNAFNCEGFGNIVLAPFTDVIGAKMFVHFYDANNIAIGSSAEFEITALTTNQPFVNIASNGWAATTDYPALSVVKDLTHIYQQVAVSGNEFVQGTSGGSEPTWPTDGSTVVDGTCTWKDLGVFGGLYNVPIIVVPNTFGASSYEVETTVNANNLMILGGAI